MERYDDNYICGQRSMTHSGQLLPNSYWGYQPNTRRREHSENCDDKDDVCVRQKEEYSRERLSWDTKHAPSDPACRNERDNYGEESNNFRDYQDNNGRYKTSDNYSYEEQAEDYLLQRWDSGGLEEGYYDDNRSGWDSDYNDSSEIFSERERYEKELPYHHEEHIWQESEVIQDNDQNFIDQTERWDYMYDRTYPKLDSNREIYKEPYEGSLREEHGNGEYHGYQERPSEETSYRTENLCERNRDWHGGREHSRTQDLHIQRPENSQNSFSQFDHTNHWPKWEVVTPNTPTRRRLSDPDVLQEARRHNTFEEDFANQRSWDKSRDLTGRKPGNFVDERPRSDEWLNISRRHFQSRGRHSTLSVNVWSKDDSHQGFARSEEIRKSSREPFDSRTSVDRKHGGDFVHSMRSHCSNSPVRGKRSSPNTSKRSSSTERSSDFKLHETSPRSEKSSHSCDLRCSLMLHQQRKHLSSLPRDRSREEGSKCSSLERGRKSSLDEHYRSSGSISSTDSTSPPKRGNRKRQHEDEKIRQDMETAKKRKQTRNSSLAHSDTANRNNENTRNKAAKSSSKSRKQPPGEQKRSTREPRDQVSSDKYNTRRAERLLRELAATLAEDNISLKRPSRDTYVAQRKVESAGGHAVKSQRYTTRSKEYHKKCHPREDEEMKQVVSDDNLQLVDSNGGDSCAKETVSELLKASEGEITTPMSRTTPLAAPSNGGNTDLDMKEVMGLFNRAKLPAENSHNAEKSASSPNDKFQPLKPMFHTKPSISSTEVSQVGIDTLKQGANNTKHKASEVKNTGTNNNGSCLLYTEPSIYTVRINDDRVDTLTQGGNNIKDCNGVNSRKRTTCAVKKQDLNAIYTEQELSNCNSDELIKESHDFDSNPRDVSDKKHTSTGVRSQKKIVHELNKTLSDANCQDKMILKIDKEGHAKVTQEVCHDSKVGHIYSTVTEGCNMEDAITNNTEQKFSAVEGINNVQGKRRDDKSHDTGREINGSSGFSDKHQRRNNDKEEDENETKSNIECSSWKCVESVATHTDQKSYDEKSIDVMPNQKGTSDAHNIETNAGNTRIGALNAERGVCGMEGGDATSCLSNAIQEEYNEKSIDCDIVIAKKQKCDNGELKISNIVTQQKRHFSKDVYPSGNARQEGNSYVTQKEMHLSKELNPGRVMQELSETNVSYVGLKPQKMFNTDCPSFSVSIPEQAGDYSKISKVDPCIVKRRSSWPSVDPYQSNAADTNKSATSSLNTCKAVHGLQKTKDLVPESFKHLDMEISSDEEHQPRSTDSAVRVVDGDSARKNDASKRYSPSNPTRKSDEHCSPHAKEDYSPYSLSYPTNVSERDLEQNDPVKELCFDDEDDGASTCEAREEIIAGGFALKNSFKGIEDGRKKRNANTTVFKQAINSDGIGVTSVNSLMLSSSLKSKSGPLLRVSQAAEGSVDVSIPVDDATLCGGKKTNSEHNKSDGKGGAACVVNLTVDGNGEDMRKPSMRCPKRTQSLPTFSSVVPRPKVMYITASKTKLVKTDSGSLHKSRIFYATNDRIAKPINSLSLDEMPSKNWIIGESSSHDPKNIKGPIVFETRQSDERKTVHDVKPVLTKRSGNSDASLKLENIATQVSDLDMGKDGISLKNAKINNVLKVSAIEGCGSFTGSMASIDKEKVDISNTTVTEQDSEVECSRAILKDKDTASGAAHFVQDTLCKDTVAHDEAGNLVTTIKGTETADVKVLSTSYSIASGGFDKSVDKEMNYSSKNCSGTPSTSIDDISSFGSVPEGEHTFVSKEIKERTSLRSYSTSFRVEGSMTEVPSNCNHKVPEGIKRDTNCGSVDTPVTCEMIDKRPITSTCEMTKYGHDNNQTLFLGTYGHVESTVLKGEVENRKDEIVKESSSNVPEQRVQTVQTLPSSSSRSGKKRSNPDQRKGSHPCKVPNKSLKLIIPSHQVFNGGANRAAKPGVSARKTSSCTVTRAELHFVPGNNGDLTSKLDTGAKEDMFASLNPRRKEKPHAKSLKKPASCTITSANLDFVPGNNSLPINQTDMLTVDRCGIVNGELSSSSNRITEIESGSRSQDWHSTTGNTSPLSKHLALHNQHNETSHSSFGNIRIEEHKEKGVLKEGKASFAGKESDWAAFKMERLRKKKEEIEQLTNVERDERLLTPEEGPLLPECRNVRQILFAQMRELTVTSSGTPAQGLKRKQEPPSSNAFVKRRKLATTGKYNKVIGSSAKKHPTAVKQKGTAACSSTSSSERSFIKKKSSALKRKGTTACSSTTSSKRKNLASTVVKEGSPSRDELEEMSQRLGTYWESLARRLGFHEGEITGFDEDYDKNAKKALKMLFEWKERHGSDATYEALYQALCHQLCKRKSLAEEFCCTSKEKRHPINL